MPLKISIIKRTLLLVIILMAFSLQLPAQDQIKVDSLLALFPAKDDTTYALIYLELKNEYQFRDEIKYKEYLDKQIEYSIKSGVDRFKMQAAYSQGVYFNNIGDLPKAEEKFNEVLTYLDPAKDGIRMAKLYGALSNLACNQGDFQEGISKVQESIDLMIEHDMEPVLLARSYRILGNIHGIIENWDLSFEYYRKSIKMFTNLGHSVEAMIDSMGIGINYIQQNQFEKAKPIMEAAIKVFEEDKDQTALIAALSNLGSIEKHFGNFEKAEALYLRGLGPAEKYGLLDEYVEMKTRLADMYNDTGKNKQAISLLKEVEEINGLYGGAEMQKVIFYELQESYDNENNYNEAYKYLQKYSTLNDSIMSVENISAINELEVKYQTEKKEQEIKLLEEKAKRSSLEKRGMIGGILGLLVLFGAFFYAMRQRMIKNKLAKEKVDQELAFNVKELDLKKKELVAYALQLAHKNEVLESIKSNVNVIKVGNESNRDLQKIVNTISINQNDDESWEGFRSRFLALHKNFEVDVKNQFPKVSVNELKLMALLRMQLTSKEIANILNISGEGIKKARYRLRKKLGLESGESLEDLILAI